MFLERSTSYSLNRLPSYNSPRSPKSSWGGAIQFPIGSSSTTTITYALGALACVLLLAHTVHDRHKISSASSTIMGRKSWQDPVITKAKQLQMQLTQKEHEIVTLKAQLELVMAATELVHTGVDDREEMIRKLQERHNSEKQARSKAQLALSERSRALETCAHHQRVLENEVQQCNRELDLVTKERHKKKW